MPAALSASVISGLREVIVIAAGITVLVVLLWLPVLGDRMSATVSRKAPKVAPRMFGVGLGILLLGLVVKVVLITVVGGCLMGLVLLAALADKY